MDFLKTLGCHGFRRGTQRRLFLCVPLPDLCTLCSKNRLEKSHEIKAQRIMILILTPKFEPESSSYKQLMAHLSRLQEIQLRVHLSGNTSSICADDIKSLPGVERV